MCYKKWGHVRTHVSQTIHQNSDLPLIPDFYRFSKVVVTLNLVYRNVFTLFQFYSNHNTVSVLNQQPTIRQKGHSKFFSPFTEELTSPMFKTDI